LYGRSLHSFWRSFVAIFKYISSQSIKTHLNLYIKKTSIIMMILNINWFYFSLYFDITLLIINLSF
jgi:hypothetical protein